MGSRVWKKIGRYKGPLSLDSFGSRIQDLPARKGRGGLRLNRQIPLEIIESPDYYIIQADMPECGADDISVSLTSRIVTIWGLSGKREGSGKAAVEANFSLYLDSPVDPSFSRVYFSGGHLYLQMLKDPGSAVHTPVSLRVNG